MYVAIDLGENNTYLACWESEQELDDAIIKVRIPGLAEFNRNDQTHPWDLQNIRACFVYLQREYLLPSRKIVQSAALSVPEIWNLNTRKALLELIEEIFGLEAAQIIPQPLALVAGYNRRNRGQPVHGDILLIQFRPSSLDFALLSSSATAGVILEKQFNGDFSRAQQELAPNAYASSSGFCIDYVLAAGPHFSSSQLEQFSSAMAEETLIICESDFDFAAAEGLFGVWEDPQIDASNRLSLIYPYDFYLATDAPAGLRKIPFDTANLELACDGIYRLTSLNYDCFENLIPAAGRVDFRIYELPAGHQPGLEMPLTRSQQVLAIDRPRGDLPPQLVVTLDMATASLHIDLAIERPARPPLGSTVLPLRLVANQDRLLHRLGRQNRDETLVRDWEKQRLTYRPECPDLNQQVQTTLFHLQALLQLWQEN